MLSSPLCIDHLYFQHPEMREIQCSYVLGGSMHNSWKYLVFPPISSQLPLCFYQNIHIQIDFDLKRHSCPRLRLGKTMPLKGTAQTDFRHKQGGGWGVMNINHHNETLNFHHILPLSTMISFARQSRNNVSLLPLSKPKYPLLQSQYCSLKIIDLVWAKKSHKVFSII